MNDFLTVLKELQTTPVPLVLVGGGILFLFLAVGGRFGAKVDVSQRGVREKAATILGSVLLILGIALYILPIIIPPSGKENKPADGVDVSQNTEEVVQPDSESISKSTEGNGNNNGDNTTSPAGRETSSIEQAALKGTVVTVYGSFTGNDAELFNRAMTPFEERTGISVEYEGNQETFDEITNRVASDNPPDIILSPQPGLLNDLVNKGYIVDLNTVFDEGYLKKQYDQSWLDMATMDGIMAGIWYKAFVKSLVWYPAEEFEEAGYQIPETWDEMTTLSDQMVADGRIPWCIGIESGGASGWPATDWIEDIMLRTTSPQNYDKWTVGELKFNSPEVRQAFEIAGDIWFEPGFVYGGRQAIVNTFFGDSAAPLFENPPGCWLHRQADFMLAFFPGNAKFGVDVDFFYLPPIESEYGKPVLISGDLAAMINDRPEVRELIKYLATGESVKALMEESVALSPHNDANTDWYGSETSRKVANILSDADVFRFDGSDLMPGEVGAGSFWAESIKYVEGKDVNDVLSDIDASWP